MEVWYRDPVECVRELLGNPVFANVLAYAPERVYQDNQGDVRQIDEMWTGDWWWETQVFIRHWTRSSVVGLRQVAAEAAPGCNNCARHPIL